MNREKQIWTVLLVFGAIGLAFRCNTAENGVGNVYVKPKIVAGRVDSNSGEIKPIEYSEDVDGDSSVRISKRYSTAERGESDDTVWSPSRTIGIWVAALLTLCAFSYLYRDNPFYKMAESIIVGVSAGYWIVLYYWQVLIGKVVLKLAPAVARYAFLPDTPKEAVPDYSYLIPVILGCLVFCRWVPQIAWLGRWPLAFVVGTTAGLKLILFIDADFVSQIRSTMLPLIVFVTDKAGARTFDLKQSLQNIVFVVSVVSSVTYFYFSVEHKGFVGRVSRIGVWVLMITFGASFALTVMGRITLLTMRLQFLFDDWLGLIKI